MPIKIQDFSAQNIVLTAPVFKKSKDGKIMFHEIGIHYMVTYDDGTSKMIPLEFQMPKFTYSGGILERIDEKTGAKGYNLRIRLSDETPELVLLKEHLLGIQTRIDELLSSEEMKKGYSKKQLAPGKTWADMPARTLGYEIVSYPKDKAKGTVDTSKIPSVYFKLEYYVNERAGKRVENKLNFTLANKQTIPWDKLLGRTFEGVSIITFKKIFLGDSIVAAQKFATTCVVTGLPSTSGIDKLDSDLIQELAMEQEMSGLSLASFDTNEAPSLSKGSIATLDLLNSPPPPDS